MSRGTGKTRGPRTAVQHDPRATATPLRGVEVGLDPDGRVRCRVDPGLGEAELREIASAMVDAARRIAPGGPLAAH